MKIHVSGNFPETDRRLWVARQAAHAC